MKGMSTTAPPKAHVAKDADGTWRAPHDLAAHLDGVAKLSSGFARLFNGEVWAGRAARLHDLGKYQPTWQQYLGRVTGFDAENAHIEGVGGHPNHSTAGALWANKNLGPAGRVLAYLIAGHHAGLSDWDTENSSLWHRLSLPDSRTELEDSLKGAPADALEAGSLPSLSTIPGTKGGFALWVRMLFSCLVDADFLDTESYMNPGKSDQRGAWPSMDALSKAFDAFMAEKTGGVEDTVVNRARADVLAQCRAMAAEAPGLFSLTVPTGGGKTLSSMAFALAHAKAHSKDRIIYVIPYTSIIEQTADVFRGAFAAVGEEVLVEHHSNAEAAPQQENSRSRLATENWDAPVIVTTSVQFFESLFAAKTSRCRKLHNICNSIVVIDEAQMLPPEYLQPILDVINLLCRHYGVTVVLSTATQPALATVNDYLDPRKHIKGLDGVREIIPDPDDLYRVLKRVEVELPADMNRNESWQEVAAKVCEHDSVLAVVNTRKDARELYGLLPQGTLHLSALMCGAHRSTVINDIKRRNRDGVPTRVVSTQLVEAGVDIDFPVVYRAMAGLDSIAQAAGRCNREGRLGSGKVVVFVPPKNPPKGLLLKGANACKSVLHGKAADPLERSLFGAYFRELYYECDLDKKQVRADLRMDGKLDKTLAVNFRTAADNFKLIEDGDQVAVVVRYAPPGDPEGGADKWIAMLGAGKPERWLMRKLQRYIVRINQRDAGAMRSRGDIKELMPGLFVQVADGLYSPEFGLQLDHVQLTPDQTIV
jgi:CRISPR-associated endonuclease/helicase Cas3